MYYFLSIKQQLCIVFYLQINGQIKKQNSIIKVYLQAFVNFKQKNWARLFLMTKFIYNNAKNASTSFTPFKLNCGYHLCISNQKDINSCSQSKLTNNLADEFKEFRVIYWENLKYTQDFQKEIYNNGTKPKSYAHNDKIWLNSKYIKIKQN